MKVLITSSISSYLSSLAIVELHKAGSTMLETAPIENWGDHFDPPAKTFVLEGLTFVDDSHWGESVALLPDGKNVVSDKNTWEEDGHFRTCPKAIEVFERLGAEKWNGTKSEWKIVEIPDDVKWRLRDGECGGGEWIEEVHRTWC